MDIKTITDAEDKELGVFIPTDLWQKIKGFLPNTDEFISSQSLNDLVQDFSLFQLAQVSQSVLSSLKAYFARSIMKEESSAEPKPDII